MPRLRTLASLTLAAVLGVGFVGCGDGEKPDPPMSEDDIDDLGPPNIESGSDGEGSDGEGSDGEGTEGEESGGEESGGEESDGEGSDGSTTAE